MLLFAPCSGDCIMIRLHTESELSAEVLKLYEIKFMPASQTIFLSNLYSEKIISMVLLSCLHWAPAPASQLGICCGNLQYKDNAYNLL